MKVLLAIDGSEHSMRAIKEVANRPFPQNTEVRILSAYERSDITKHMESMGTLREYYAEIDKEAVESAQAVVEKAKQLIKDKNPALALISAVIEGAPKHVILKEAETFGANIIILGSHGYGAVKNFLLGSVSHAVALHAKCSVEIIR